jgi:hypothetical protein
VQFGRVDNVAGHFFATNGETKTREVLAKSFVSHIRFNSFSARMAQISRVDF